MKALVGQSAEELVGEISKEGVAKVFAQLLVEKLLVEKLLVEKLLVEKLAEQLIRKLVE